jgi:PAS domain S-box-containing protein
MVRQFVGNYLLVSLVPILFILALMSCGALFAKSYLSDLIRESVHDLNKDAEYHLKLLGQDVIRGKARDVAKQVAIFLKRHPAASIQDLQDNTEFRRIAMQKVGATGYTCLYEAFTGIMRIHPNPKLVNRDMSFLAKELPSWWRIFEPTLKGEEVSGYYDWMEGDGSVRKKYMTMTPIPEDHQGKTFMIAATTYIDEFSRPIEAMETKANQITSIYQEYMARKGLLAGLVIVAFLALSFVAVYISGRRAALRYILPIERLANAAKKLGQGEWDMHYDERIMNRIDEIGALAREFNRMRSQLKTLFDDLEMRLDELRQTQGALKESEEHYRSLFDGVPVGLYRTTPEGEIIGANNTLVRMLGYPDRESLLKRNASELYVQPEDRMKWKADMVEKRTNFTSEYQMRRQDGTTFWVEDHTLVVQDEEGKALHYEGSLKDITETKQAEEGLRRSEERYRTLYRETKRAEEVYRSLLHNSADAIVIYDLEERTKYISPAFTSLFGWTLEELEGKRIPFLPDSEMETTKAFIEVLTRYGQPCQGYETKRYTKDGRLLDVSISASRYDDHEGNPAGMLVMIRDISERKQLEAQLLRAQKLEAIGTLAGGIAHDFNNMMMGVLGNISLMLFETSPSDPNYEMLQSIDSMIRSASRLTDKLLGYARKGRYEIKPLDINQLVGENSETFGRTRREIEIQLDLYPGPIAIEADKSQIEQVLMNLFINAADAMSSGGFLNISTTILPHTDITNKAYQAKEGEYVLLRIHDSGVGMDKETLERIFDPFFTTKEMGRGTGLGLASVYGIIKGHGGYIDVESQKGQGTTFNIYLPRSKRKVALQSEPAEPLKKGSGTVLLVDDEDGVLEIGSEMLKRIGYKTLKARKGEEAIELYKARKDQIDLVILDMIMPGMGGGKVFDRIKEMAPEAKVLLSSGYSRDGQASDILRRGCDGFIQKPFDLGQLSRKIHEILSN